MSFVVDASVTLAWCFEDEHTPAVMELLDRVAEDGAVTPQLWPVEAVNGLLAAERRGRITAGVRQRLTGFLRELPIGIDDETAGRVWTSAVHLAETHRLTAYDASYLELAIRLGLPLGTRDQLLATAARNAGVEVLSGA